MNFIDPREAKALVEQGAQLVDVRDPHEFQQGALPGAINLPLAMVPLKAAEVLDRTRPVVLYCLSGATYTYIVADPATREAAIIDSVKSQVDRDIQVMEEMGVKPRYALETHVHADHVTGAGELRERLGVKVGVHKDGGAQCADLQLDDGDEIRLGNSLIRVLHTPGHTNGDVSYLIDGAVFTGDALLIRGCGRTDFQPGHDYRGLTVSTIGEEKRFNPRLGNGRDKASFVALMEALDLDPPRYIDVAVPGNLRCGM